MQDMLEILKELGIDVPDDKVGDLNSLVVKNYRTINDYNRIRTKVDDLTAQLGETSAALDKAKDTKPSEEEIAKLRANIAELESKNRAREEAAAERKAREDFEKDFDAALGDKQFASDLVRSTVADRAYEMKKKNPDMEVSSAISTVVGDGEGVWKNPQQDVRKMQAGSDADTKGHVTSLDQLAGKSNDYINEHWGEISQLLGK